MTSFIPFLVGSTVASILVLAVVVAIVIARSGGSDAAIPHWPSRATFTPAGPELPPLLEREAVIRVYASCGGRYSGDERRARAETVTDDLDQGPAHGRGDQSRHFYRVPPGMGSQDGWHGASSRTSLK